MPSLKIGPATANSILDPEIRAQKFLNFGRKAIASLTLLVSMNLEKAFGHLDPKFFDILVNPCFI